jgi:diadenosine tetraphosphatase ApaH/serine/threonine PP2A family protein phosphatase
VLGQTHHPLLRGTAEDGLLLNPGSVGQPRDGDPSPSWALVDLASGRAQLRRSSYDIEATVERLRAIGWDEDVIAALGHRPGGTPEPAARTSPQRTFLHQ